MSCSRKGGLSVTHILHNETWHSYILPKEDPKYINHVTHPLSSAEMSIISPEIRNLFYQEIQTAFYYIISTSFKGCFNKHICNFDDASKFGFSRPSLNEGILKLRF